MTEATAEGSNTQNNATSIENTREEHFPHFGIIGANSFEGFRILEKITILIHLQKIITTYHYYYYQDSEED